MKDTKKQTGITLIALVITIIVLLILAGVSIALLTGENGILIKATTASEQTKEKEVLEKVKIAVAGSFDNNGKYNVDTAKINIEKEVEGSIVTKNADNTLTVKVDGYTIKVSEIGKVSDPIKEGESEVTTKPYLPSNDFSYVSGTDLDTGLVIKDSNGNSYVWVEVPKNLYTTATSNTDYTKIETDMQTYATAYRTSWTDTWYNGCGLTESEYNNLKNKMLASVYDNGGFWISQYEIGTDTIRTSSSTSLTTPVSKEGMYPYNYLTVSQAQTLASGLNSGSYNSSLLFGIQWDLTLKYIESKGSKTQDQLKTDSTEWGNYSNATFNITKGKYSGDVRGRTFSEVTGTYTKPEGTSVLLTTGAMNRNSTLNIYDLAGNVYEWTLEKSTDSSKPASHRGGCYIYNGNNYPASVRLNPSTSGSSVAIGFHSTLY